MFKRRRPLVELALDAIVAITVIAVVGGVTMLAVIAAVFVLTP